MGTEVGQLAMSLQYHLLLIPSVCLYLKLYDRYDRKDTVHGRGGCSLGFQVPTEGFGQSRVGVAVYV